MYHMKVRGFGQQDTHPAVHRKRAGGRVVKIPGTHFDKPKVAFCYVLRPGRPGHQAQRRLLRQLVHGRPVGADEGRAPAVTPRHQRGVCHRGHEHGCRNEGGVGASTAAAALDAVLQASEGSICHETIITVVVLKAPDGARLQRSINSNRMELAQNETSSWEYGG